MSGTRSVRLASHKTHSAQYVMTQIRSAVFFTTWSHQQRYVVDLLLSVWVRAAIDNRVRVPASVHVNQLF